MSPLHDLIEGEADPDARQSVTLRRATTQDRRFFDWYRDAAKRKNRERSVSIIQLDDADGKAVNIWRLEHARPVRWTGPGFDALSSEIAMEELEVSYKSIAWRSRL